jgi:hypothetical protein
MADRSLFPDYADAETRPARSACCADVTGPQSVPERVWSFMHTLCHSRVPFTINVFAAIAACTETQARTAITAARHRDWLNVVWPEPYMTDPIEQWVGALPRRR